MIYLFYTIHVLNCLFLILVVLLQQGKGADLSVFGGGGTMTAFGARGAATLLHKMTVFGFVGFIVTTLVIGILQKSDSGSSVMTDIPAVEETTATQDGDGATDQADDVGALPEAEGDTEILPESETFEDPADTDGGEPEEDSATADEEPAGEEAGNS